MRYRILLVLWVSVVLCMGVGAQAQTYLPEEGTLIERRHYPTVPGPLGKTQQERMQAQRKSNQTQTFPPKGLLLLVQFSDMAFFTPNPHAAFDSLANSIDYTYNGAMGSAREYFRSQSNGQYVPDFTVVGPVTLPHTMDYYGTNASDGYDQYLADFVIDACVAVKDSVDWTQFDSDNDGEVDLVFLLFAGYGEADSYKQNTIWPCKWEVTSALYYGYTNQTTYYYRSQNDKNLPIFEGKTVDKFACSCEWAYYSNSRNGIGTFVHEFSHVLGLPDYYVLSGENSHTPGSWSLMDYGNYVNNGNTPPNYSAYDKYFLGWVTPTFLSTNQQVTLPADGKTYYMLTRNGIAPANGAFIADTVYYLENRQYTGWDTYLPGHGLLVWQVVYDEQAWVTGLPNTDAVRYTPVSASGTAPRTISTIGAKREDVPFPGSEEVTILALSPKAILQDIREQTDGTITFTFVASDEPTSIKRTTDNGSGRYYNILGQEVDVDTYQGIVIQDGRQYLLIH
ncbi:MAG: M6 family metalloprotease domain-containing protein [Paludibacteraceae bacterium]